MSQVIDLMPAASRARLRSKTAARRVAVLFISTGAVALTVSLGLHLAAAARRVELTRLQKETKVHADIAGQLEALRKDATHELASLRRFARAANPVSLCDLVSIVADIMPDGVSLTSLSVSPRIERTARGVGRMVGTLNIEMSGLAPTDLEVATFVAGLESNTLFGRVTIERAKAIALAGQEGRDFAVTCEVDLSTRRIVADAFSDLEVGGVIK
jgi:hypothetical protein